MQNKGVSPKIHPSGIVSHCFSPNLKSIFYKANSNTYYNLNIEIAVSIKESNHVEIYEIGDLKVPSSWKKIYTLKEVSY